MTYLDVGQAMYTTLFSVAIAGDRRTVEVEDVHVMPDPSLPPSGWIGRAEVAGVNTRYRLEEAWSRVRRRTSGPIESSSSIK
jgi:hypothetical protein